MEKIQKVKNKLVSQNISGIALDIDDTLSWTVHFWFSEMVKNFGNPENMSIDELIEKYKYSFNVPYWQSNEALEWVSEKVKSNELQKMLPLMGDADVQVDRIHKIIPVIAYITVRPESVKDGTEFWLRKYSFPKAEIICRPDDIPHSEGNKWKAEVLNDLYPQVVGIVDDNPALAENLVEGYKGTVYKFENNWDEIYEMLKLKY